MLLEEHNYGSKILSIGNNTYSANTDIKITGKISKFKTIFLLENEILVEYQSFSKDYEYEFDWVIFNYPQQILRFVKFLGYGEEFMKFEADKIVKDIIKVVHLGGTVNKNIMMIFCKT